MMKKLLTGFNSVFELSPDGRTFTSPELMEGVPVERLQESDEYYERSWVSFDIWQHKINEYETQAKSSPQNSNYQVGKDDDQRHPPNIAKVSLAGARKVVKWFGPGTPIHPNQLVSKRVLASDGLSNSWAILDASRSMENLEPL